MAAAPGKAHREGISLVQLMDMFPDEAAAREWFETARWGDQRVCPRCGSANTKPVPSGKPNALPLRRVPAVFQRENRHRHAVV